MASRANNAALNAAMVAGGYSSVNNMVVNYRIPANYKNRAANMKAQKRAANTKNTASNYYYDPNKNMYVGTKPKQTKSNIEYDREVIKNLIRMGIKSAKPTKKERKNADAERARRAKAANVITKRFIKSKAPGAKKARERRVKEAAANYRRRLNEEKRAAAATERARAAAQRLAEGRSRIGEVTTGRRLKVTSVVTPGQRHNVAPPSRAVPPTLNRGPVLSPNARAAMAAAVASAVTAPRATPKPAPSGAHSRLAKTMKKMGRG